MAKDSIEQMGNGQWMLVSDGNIKGKEYSYSAVFETKEEAEEFIKNGLNQVWARTYKHLKENNNV